MNHSTTSKRGLEGQAGSNTKDKSIGNRERTRRPEIPLKKGIQVKASTTQLEQREMVTGLQKDSRSLGGGAFLSRISTIGKSDDKSIVGARRKESGITQARMPVHGELIIECRGNSEEIKSRKA
jgi:hypothetical protein